MSTENFQEKFKLLLHFYFLRGTQQKIAAEIHPKFSESQVPTIVLGKTCQRTQDNQGEQFFLR